jgi:hypothetical protein
MGPARLVGLKRKLGLKKGLELKLLRKVTMKRRGRKWCLFLITQSLKKLKWRDLVARPSKIN